MKILARLARIAGLVSLCIALVAFAFLVLGPRTGRYRTLTVLSGSMSPAYPPGSVVVVVPVPVKDITVGDVVTYKIPVDDHRVVTHRVIEVVEPGVIRTQGDANQTPDAWTTRLKGPTAWEVRAGLPGLGFALNALQTKAVSGASMIVMPILLAFVWLREIWRREALPGPVVQPVGEGGA